MKHRVEVYGVGGFDPSKKNGNVVEVYEVDVPDPEEPTQAERIAALEAEITALKKAAKGGAK